jgi:hypothetical protein
MNKLFLLLLPWLLFAKVCSDYYKIEDLGDSYKIEVYDEDEEFIPLEARLLLYKYIKKKNKLKGNFALELKHFFPIKEFKCSNGYHEVYLIKKKNIKIKKVQASGLKENQLSYKDVKRKIYRQIAEISVKDHKTLKDLYKLYNLYFSLGKIESANKVMEQIMQYNTKGW